MKNLLPLITVISIPLASPLGASADETLTSNPAATGLGQSGNIFNIKAKKAIKINGFSQDFSSNNSTHYKSYYKIGGYEGSVKTRSNYPQNYFDSSGWTLMGQTNESYTPSEGTTNTIETVNFDSFTQLDISKDQTVGLWLFNEYSSPLNFNDWGTTTGVGDILAEDDSLIIYSGYGYADFNANTYGSARAWRGAISYILQTEWAQAQPYAAMQHVGLDAIKNKTALVLDNAGECKNNCWNIDGSKYSLFVAASNLTSDVYGDSTYGGYETANFTLSYGVELNHNDAWTLGLSYGNGTSNLGDYNFSDTTASLESDNNFYYAYAVKQANENLKLSWLVGITDHKYDSSRTYSGDTATSSYSSHGYAAAMDAVWDKQVIGKKGRPYKFQPKLRVSYASHKQDGFSETGEGDLMTISKSENESFYVKGGIEVSTQLVLNQGKNILVPRIGLAYEIDVGSDSNTSDSIQATLTENTSETTKVIAKKIESNKGLFNIGGDYYLTDRLMVNVNANLKVTGEGSESSYGGGFSWSF